MMKLNPTSLQISLYYTFFLLLLSHAKSQLYDQEHTILMQLKQHWQNPQSLDHWTQSNSSHCTWHEITCTKNSITALSLIELNITQTIPPFICDLKNLTHLDLQWNYLAGTFPKVLYNCPKLEYLDLSGNNFVGKIPDDIDRLAQLQVLILGANLFSGDIPPAIGRLPELRTLRLSYNQFNGTFPPEIGNLPNLEILDMAYNNKFVPSRLPSSFTQLKKLQILLMSEANLTGEIPEMIGEMVALVLLDLSANRLTGKIPASLWTSLNLSVIAVSDNMLTGELPDKIHNLLLLEISNNRFSGKIPTTVSSWSSLRIFSASNNLFTGMIPKEITALPSLTALLLDHNQLIGSLPPFQQEFCSSSQNTLTGENSSLICNKSSLAILNLSYNMLSGMLPQYIGNLSKSLSVLDLHMNNFHGTIPEAFSKGCVLKKLNFNGNQLEGPLPKTLVNCSNLDIVDLGNNKIDDKFPYWLGSLPELRVLILRSNKFHGHVQGSKANRSFPKLQIFDLSNNDFEGPLPTEYIKNLNAMMYLSEGISKLQHMGVMGAENNLYDYSVSLTLATKNLEIELVRVLTIFAIIDLSNNKFEGEIPEVIGMLRLLKGLNFSNNRLKGDIPPVIGNLTNLEWLDLSSNKLDGEIPRTLEDLTYLAFLNLSHNQLIGSIPRGSQFSTFTNDSYVGNLGLCGFPLTKTCSAFEPPALQENDDSESKYLAWVLSAVIAIFVLGLLFAFFTIRVYRKRRHALDSTWKLISFQRLNFTGANILSGLSESNEIGSGGSGKVYRVVANLLGEIVAVKRIWNNIKVDQKLEKEFLAEVQILSTIRHSNIVKLLCCISSETSMLLVYEYLKNGSLDRWLHKRNRPSSVSGSVHHFVLDWPKRLQIAIGAARGLCYMHHDCLPPIVHRDVKSSNILLDSEFNAKIADFGLAKMLIKQGELATMSVVAGSCGYIAPEYAHMTRVNEKIDVYSFGVVLLELTTGREANDGDVHTCLAEWAWRHIQEGIHIVDALDEEIKEPCYLDEMIKVFKLGIVCTSTLPSARPSMREVLQILLPSSQQNLNGKKNTGSK